MPRPKKHRICEGNLRGKAYKPTSVIMKRLQRVILYSDEVEALKLCDFEGLIQQQAGLRMGVSRGTVQRILTSARRKVAKALVEGAAMVFED